MRIKTEKLKSIIGDRSILDVGGGRSRFPYADLVLDIRDGDTCVDICRPWPLPDNSFEFAICAQTLEDVRDPIFVCGELQRVAKAGYIETPSWRMELSRIWDKMTLAGEDLSHGVGYPHHRWIVQNIKGELVFTQKFPYPYYLDIFIEPVIECEEDLYLSYFWEHKFSAKENFLIETIEVEEWYKNLGVL